jgi:hypothetical protein
MRGSPLGEGFLRVSSLHSCYLYPISSITASETRHSLSQAAHYHILRPLIVGDFTSVILLDQATSFRSCKNIPNSDTLNQSKTNETIKKRALQQHGNSYNLEESEAIKQKKSRQTLEQSSKFLHHNLFT